MAARTKTVSAPVKMTAAQVRKQNEELKEKLEKFESYGYCYMCDAHKSKDKFYTSTDPRIKSEITPICKECARKIALRVDKQGGEHEPTKESVKLALSYLNKPYIDNVWNASIQESQNLISGKIKTNVWTSYVKNIAMVQYVGMTYLDSDMFKETIIYKDEETAENMILAHQGQDTYDAFIKNKEDVIRLLDYDPFEKESVSDQPFLYSQLLGLLDQNGEANEDMLRISASISIVRGFLQANKIDDTLVNLMSDITRLEQNSATIKSLQESKSKILSNIKDLAAENCLSLKNSKVNTKGANSFTGKLKKLRDLNLRERSINGFSNETCLGMQQAANVSMEAIFRKLNMDESDWAEIVKEQRANVTKLNAKCSALEESVRILLQENIDLRDFLESRNLLDKKDLLDLNEVINVYEQDKDSETEDESV